MRPERDFLLEFVFLSVDILSKRFRLRLTAFFVRMREAPLVEYVPNKGMGNRASLVLANTRVINAVARDRQAPRNSGGPRIQFVRPTWCFSVIAGRHDRSNRSCRYNHECTDEIGSRGHEYDHPRTSNEVDEIGQTPFDERISILVRQQHTLAEDNPYREKQKHTGGNGRPQLPKARQEGGKHDTHLIATTAASAPATKIEAVLR